MKYFTVYESKVKTQTRPGTRVFQNGKPNHTSDNSINNKAGCHYSCANPDDCKHRDIRTHQDLPQLTHSKNAGDGDICLCKGDYCNDEILFPNWAIFLIVLASITGSMILCWCCILSWF